MKRPILFLLLIVGILSCRKDSPEQGIDSVLTQPGVGIQQAPSGVYVDSEKNLIIDSSSMRPPEHQRLLDRFSAREVRDIYHEYRPLRKATATEAQRAEFLRTHKLTLDELKAILAEGDQLGWSQVK
jgi:hypothetical protein